MKLFIIFIILIIITITILSIKKYYTQDDLSPGSDTLIQSQSQNSGCNSSSYSGKQIIKNCRPINHLKFNPNQKKVWNGKNCGWNSSILYGNNPDNSLCDCKNNVCNVV